MKDQKVSTVLGAIILVIIAVTIAGFVLLCFKNYPVKDDVSSAVDVYRKRDIDKDMQDKNGESQCGFGGKFVVSSLVDEWQQYTNQYCDYTISMPTDFDVQDEEVTHIDISSSDYDGVNKDGIRIQIQKKLLPKDYDSILDFKKYITESQDTSIIVKKIGDSVDVSYYATSVSDGDFMTYFAFDDINDVYYKIIIFEPGYSNNQNLVESIVKTFIIL